VLRLQLLLSDATADGVWSSSNVSVAVVSPTGAIIGYTGGVTMISYTVTNGLWQHSCNICNNSDSFAGTPAAITGLFSVCSGNTNLLSDVTFGGAWTTAILLLLQLQQPAYDRFDCRYSNDQLY